MDCHRLPQELAKLVKKYGRWEKVTELSDGEQKILVGILNLVGYLVSGLVIGRAKSHLRDQGGEIMETHPINGPCPYKAVYIFPDRATPEEHARATSWLQSLLGFLIRRPEEGSEFENFVYERLQYAEVPSHIKLTRDGDMLVPEFREPYDILLDERPKVLRSEDVFSGDNSGFHEYCKGEFERRRSTDNLDVLVCKECCLRVTFPAKVKTYQELANYLHQNVTYQR